MLKKCLIVLFAFLSQAAWSASIIGSKHDLSTTNYYGPYSGATTQICVFCHTPHGGNVGFEGPL
ncbi:hypothetical protein, partial [Hydrogenimonas sp.]